MRSPAARWVGLMAAAIVALTACVSHPPPTPRPSAMSSPSPGATATHSAPRPSPTIAPSTPTQTPPAPAMPAESSVDASDWVALEWREGALERPGGPITVTDVGRWGNGYIAVGFSGRGFNERAGDGLIWLSTDGLNWRLVPDNLNTLDGAELCCVTRARDAFIAWTGRSGIFVSSVDGRNWQRTERSVDRLPWAVEAADGLLAVPRVLLDGVVWRTTDGVEWASQSASGLHLQVGSFSSRGLLATKIGYFLAGEASQGGVAGAAGSWGNWFSRDGRTWRETKLPSGDEPHEAKNGAHFEEGHRYVYAPLKINSGVYFADWLDPPWLRTANGIDWEEVERPLFPDAGRYDGHFTLDIQDLVDGGPTRLSPDGVGVIELETRGAELRRVAADAYLHTAIGPNGIAVLADNGQGVWFGQAVHDSPTDKPAVYCAPAAAVCLDLIRQVAPETTAGSAFVVEASCLGWFDCFWENESAITVVAVPPGWPESGELQRWDHEKGRLRGVSVTALPDHIQARLPHEGPWTDALISNRLWVNFNGLDRDGVQQVMSDHSIHATLPDDARFYWIEVGIADYHPATTKLEFLRRDRRICAVELVRFDPSILRGGAASRPLETPEVVGCPTPPTAIEFDLPVYSGPTGCTLQFLGAPILHGSASAGPPVWAVDGDTTITDIGWPPGYRAMFAPDLAIVDSGGRTLWREGDLLDTVHEHDVYVCYLGTRVVVFDPDSLGGATP